jgi:hypothetical protein
MVTNKRMMDISRLTQRLSIYFAGRDEIALAFQFGSVDPTPISARFSIISKYMSAQKCPQNNLGDLEVFAKHVAEYQEG